MNLTPIVYVRGVVRRITDREVAAYEGRPASVDPESGERIRARDARQGYSVADLVVLTDEGGFCEVAFNKADHRSIPSEGEIVEIPCRIFAGWKSTPRGSFQTVRLIAEPMAAPVARAAS
jgi:hypothetical protein